MFLFISLFALIFFSLALSPIFNKPQWASDNDDDDDDKDDDADDEDDCDDDDKNEDEDEWERGEMPVEETLCG